MSSPVRTFSRSISLMGIFLCSEKVRCLNSIGARNVNVSISSLAAAYTYHQSIDRNGRNGNTFPARARAAHCASASQGALTYGTPINLRRRLHSSLCSFVTLTVLRLNLSTSSDVPISFASSFASFASSRFAYRFANYHQP
jgi:uncharacterized membrane protein YjjP (DUF1212 family)